MNNTEEIISSCTRSTPVKVDLCKSYPAVSENIQSKSGVSDQETLLGPTFSNLFPSFSPEQLVQMQKMDPELRFVWER